MTEQLELVLLVAFVVSVTGLLITGVVRWRSVGPARSETGPDGSVRQLVTQANGTANPSAPAAQRR